jgi:hypothetical protein
MNQPQNFQPRENALVRDIESRKHFVVVYLTPEDAASLLVILNQYDENELPPAIIDAINPQMGQFNFVMQNGAWTDKRKYDLWHIGCYRSMAAQPRAEIVLDSGPVLAHPEVVQDHKMYIRAWSRPDKRPNMQERKVSFWEVFVMARDRGEAMDLLAANVRPEDWQEGQERTIIPAPPVWQTHGALADTSATPLASLGEAPF